MIAKLVVWGQDRSDALRKLRNGLAQYNIDGLSSNVNFLIDLASHPEFEAGNVDTDFIPRHHDELFPKRVISDQRICEAALAVVLDGELAAKEASKFKFDPFVLDCGARLGHCLTRTIHLTFGDQTFNPRIVYQDNGTYRVYVGDKSYEVKGSLKFHPEANFTELTCSVDGSISKQRVLLDASQVRLFTAEGGLKFDHKVPKFVSERLGGGSLGDAVAPMPGVIEKVMVNDGDQVKSGDPLVVMIAMKMEYVIKAPKDGVVEKVLHKVGDFVAKNTALVHFKEEGN